MQFNTEQHSMFNNQPAEEYSGMSASNSMSSSPETGRIQSSQSGQDNQLNQQDFKNHRNARRIDGPVIPTEYSDPDLQRQSSEFSAILQQATTNVSAKRHESTFVMDISPSVVGWIIGRSGIRIKEIQSYTGCKMWVDQDVPNDQPRKIYFHGNKQNIDAAVGRVNELVQAAPILSSNHVVSGKGLTSVIVDCPVSLVGLLIGKRGWTIKKIQQASNAQISINQSVREGLPRKIIVSGDEQSVSLALKLITEVLRDKTLLGSNGGEQLTMRMVSGNGYPMRDSGGSMPMPMREGSPSMSGHDQGQGQGQSYSPQQHHFSRSGGGSSPPSSSSEMDYMNNRDADRYSSNSNSQPHMPQSQGQPYHSSSHNYHGHHNQSHSQSHGQGGGGYQHLQGQGQGQGHGGYQSQSKRGGYHGNSNNHHHHHHHHHANQHQHQQHHGQYQEPSSRLYSNQYGQNQQHQQTMPIPVRNNNNYGGQSHGNGHHYGGSQEGGHQYGDEPPYQQQQTQPQRQSMSGSAELNKYHLQRETSPDSVEVAGGGSFNSNASSSIFDFQHRNSPSVGQSEPGGQQQQHDGAGGQN